MEINPEFLKVAKESVDVPKLEAAAPAPETNPVSTAAITKSPAKAVVDAVFMMDCTGSMSSFIAKAKQTIKKMITDIKEHYNESSIFVGFVAYRDHCDKDLLQCKDLTGDVEDIYKFIDTLSATGGGDTAEAVADGLDYAANKISWREEDALRLLIHVCDAPPHGKEFGCSSDDYPNGCPCKLDYKEALKKLGKLKVQYLVLNFTRDVDTMINVYKQYYEDIEGMSIANDLAQSASYAAPCEADICCEDEEMPSSAFTSKPPAEEEKAAMGGFTFAKAETEIPPASAFRSAPPKSMPVRSAADMMEREVSSKVMSKAMKKWG